MKIKVIKTTQASQDASGTKIVEYKAGEVYDIYQELAEVFISQEWGIQAQDSKIKIETQDLKIETIGTLNHISNFVKDFPKKNKNNAGN